MWLENNATYTCDCNASITKNQRLDEDFIIQNLKKSDWIHEWSYLDLSNIEECLEIKISLSRTQPYHDIQYSKLP
jgi:hypothetical protein